MQLYGKVVVLLYIKGALKIFWYRNACFAFIGLLYKSKRRLAIYLVGEAVLGFPEWHIIQVDKHRAAFCVTGWQMVVNI